MRTCYVCKFAVVLDDQLIDGGSDRGNITVCIRCFYRETGEAKPMPKALIREIEHVLAAV